jgi:hypothetical protein
MPQKFQELLLEFFYLPSILLHFLQILLQSFAIINNNIGSAHCSRDEIAAYTSLVYK